jgi:hypothetical protein
MDWIETLNVANLTALEGESPAIGSQTFSLERRHILQKVEQRLLHFLLQYMYRITVQTVMLFLYM